MAESCQGDEELKGEVEAMIAQDTSGGGILDRPVWDKLKLRTSAAWLPQAIGRYQIRRLLGEGGMGVVYEAEQDHPCRTVALKVIRPGLASEELLLRFERESHALGRLQHPGIAQIYEAGTADAGFGPQPYFAMEFIRGESLRDYAAAHHLDTRQRLEVIAKICDAVEHAHQRGLIHRDLKPGNILVDETGQPKILDFGVARLTDSEGQVTRQTDLGQLVGTLAYMSPEQVQADPLELDTRSDVYALGVILYELLAGRLPYHISNKLHEAVQTIREEDPTRLSSISRNYRGDIETIVAKALEKDKARRYASAAALAADIRRCLSDEPIMARPASASYQLQKFARRHKALVGGVAAVFVVLVSGIVASSWEALRARRAEQTAVVAQQTAQAVNDFLQNDLLAQASASNQAGPDTKPDPDLKVRTALDRASAKIAGKFATQPAVEASIRQTIGSTYRDLGLYSEARQQMEHALDLRRRALGEKAPSALSTMNLLAEVYMLEGDYRKAESLYTKALEIRRSISGEEQPDTLEVMNNLGELYELTSNFSQAEVLLSKVLAIQRRVSGAEHPDTLDAMNNLAVAYLSDGKYGQAEALLDTALEIRHRVSGDEHQDTLAVMDNLAQVSLREGKFARAEALDGQALEISRRIYGSEHPSTLIKMNNLAGIYRTEGKYVQSEALFANTLEIRRRVSGEGHPETLIVMHNLALVYQREAKYVQAEELFTKVLDLRRRVLGDENFDTLTTSSALGLVRLQLHKYGEAEKTLRSALRSYEKTSPEVWQRYNCQSLLGASLAGQQRYVEAEPLLLAGYEGMIQRAATIPAQNRYYLEEAQNAILRLYQSWGKPEKLAEWRQKFVVDRQHDPKQ